MAIGIGASALDGRQDGRRAKLWTGACDYRNTPISPHWRLDTGTAEEGVVQNGNSKKTGGYGGLSGDKKNREEKSAWL
jgi:hypothetical protein